VTVAFAALVVLALIGGVIGTTWQSIRAERERAAAETERLRAERRFENLRKISNSLVSEIERAIRDLPGSLPARKLLLARAVEQLDALAEESDGNTDLQLELVWAYQNLGTLPDKKLSERRMILEKAVALTEKILAERPADQSARDRLAMLYLDMIFNSRLRGDVNYTLEYNRRAVEIVENILREGTDDPGFQDSFWTVYYHYTLTMQQLGKSAETVETGRKILPAAEYLYRNEPPGTDKYNFMKPHLTRTAIGYGLSYAGDYQTAINEFQTALSECQAEFVKRPNTDILRRNEANIRLQLATALENAGDATAALKHAQTAFSIRERMAAENPKDLDFQVALADAELFIGQMLARQNQSQTIVPRFRRALASYEKMMAIDDERMQVKILAARAKASLGSALILNGDDSEGLRYLREAVQFYESAGAANTIDAHLKRHFAESCAWLAQR
jgi:non-specific serine/threonine protein kinase/serine/threonine-protein kinase